MSEQYDIAIIGAGPAGTACALGLRESGLRVALLDKALFPRDKVCGDAIPGRALRVLQELVPDGLAGLEAISSRNPIRSCLVVGPEGGSYDYRYHRQGLCMRRTDWDAYLLELVRGDGRVHLHLGQGVESLQRTPGGWCLKGEGPEIHARLLIGCDGANGVSARQLVGFELDPGHHCAAVRAYYAGVEGLAPDRMEIHLLKGWLPGYCWIFPLGDGTCNVGFGMLSKDVAARKVSLREALPAMVASVPGLKERFAGARLEGPIRGFGLPLGSRWVPMSGDGFLLCGDAASLIDPATGEGIGNAMWSGQVAARHAIQAFTGQDLGAAHLRQYDLALRAKLWPELRRKAFLQRLLAHRPATLDWLLRRANSALLRPLVHRLF